MPRHEGKRWAFAATLRLSAAALLVVMLSLLVEGLTSSALVIAAAVLALLGLIEFLHAWRSRSNSRR
jgi:heme/copper-type cytochrome/quinol oxidase subunit 4